MKRKLFSLLMAVLTAGVMTSFGQGFTVLHSFNNTSPSTNGFQPMAGLVLGGNTLYGTTSGGGTNGDVYGTVFSIDTTGSNFTAIHSFDGTNGSFPAADLILASNTLYGVTQSGGAANGSGNGVVFSVRTDGSNFNVLHRFTNSFATDGDTPMGGLILSRGVLYGTTERGGTNLFYGAVFAINTDGAGFKLLYSFGGADGSQPACKLALVGDTLFGTTSTGGEGDNANGTIFSINTNGGAFSLLHSFTNGPEGVAPVAGLVPSGSKLYGTTTSGGTNGYGTVFSMEGTDLEVLHDFTFDVPNNALWDWGPWHGSLIVSGDKLYGTTQEGRENIGADYGGTIFSLNTDGTGFTILRNLTNDVQSGAFDGAWPFGGLVWSDDTLYGAAAIDGTNGGGTIFRFCSCNSTSAPIIQGIVLNTNSTVTITSHGDPFCPYVMKAGTNLLIPTSSWLSIATNLTGADGIWRVTDSIDLNADYICSTNLIFGDGGGVDPGSDPTNVIGTNVSCNYELRSWRFYRAARQ